MADQSRSGARMPASKLPHLRKKQAKLSQQKSRPPRTKTSRSK
jgi:hypothetical protein